MAEKERGKEQARTTITSGPFNELHHLSGSALGTGDAAMTSQNQEPGGSQLPSSTIPHSQAMQKLLILIRSHLFVFAFISSILGGVS